MRKFRGLTKEGKWVYGYYVVEGYKKPKPHFIVEVGGTWNTVIPETLGQQTGLKDKNGKEIWEGDIVLFDETVENMPNTKHVIKWSFDGGHFTGGGILGAGDYDGKDCKIIGNIRQNPELMEQSNDSTHSR